MIYEILNKMKLSFLPSKLHFFESNGSLWHNCELLMLEHLLKQSK